jgi:hypothetical protein
MPIGQEAQADLVLIDDVDGCRRRLGRCAQTNNRQMRKVGLAGGCRGEAATMIAAAKRPQAFRRLIGTSYGCVLKELRRGRREIDACMAHSGCGERSAAPES